jgi:DNA-binding transcriptional LysR family regulator
MALRTAQPDVEVSLEVANSHDVADQVRHGRVELGFIESPVRPLDLHSRQVAGDHLVVVAGPAHAWARRRRPVTAAELAGTALIVRERGSGTRAALERVLAAEQMTEPLVELGSNAAVKILVQTGAGPAVLSALATAGEIRDGRLVAVPTAGLDLRRPLRAVWRRRARLSAPAEALLAVSEREGARARG